MVPDSEPPNRASTREILTISQLNRAIASLLEQNVPALWVAGEISNFTRAASGHWYFTLKDAAAQVRAVMFRGRAQAVGFVPREGDQVEVRALATLYQARGDFQLAVELMRRAGAGDLLPAVRPAQGEAARRGPARRIPQARAARTAAPRRRGHLAAGGGAARRPHHARPARAPDPGRRLPVAGPGRRRAGGAGRGAWRCGAARRVRRAAARARRRLDRGSLGVQRRGPRSRGRVLADPGGVRRRPRDRLQHRRFRRRSARGDADRRGTGGGPGSPGTGGAGARAGAAAGPGAGARDAVARAAAGHRRAASAVAVVLLAPAVAGACGDRRPTARRDADFAARVRDSGWPGPRAGLRRPDVDAARRDVAALRDRLQRARGRRRADAARRGSRRSRTSSNWSVRSRCSSAATRSCGPRRGRSCARRPASARVNCSACSWPTGRSTSR